MTKETVRRFSILIIRVRMETNIQIIVAWDNNPTPLTQNYQTILISFILGEVRVVIHIGSRNRKPLLTL